jgi:hypothetical protein
MTMLPDFLVHNEIVHMLVGSPTSHSRPSGRRGHSWLWPWTGSPSSYSPWAPPGTEQEGTCYLPTEYCGRN